MSKKLFIEIDGVKYQKSSYSVRGGGQCVGVACKDAMVLVTNTNSRGPVVRFTKGEWRVFVAGVKRGEFDIDCFVTAP